MSEIDTHEATHNNLVIHVLAPLAAMGATWATRKALDTGYRSVTGRIAPNSQDVQVRLGSAVMWAAITAASAAIVEVAVFRSLAKKA
ncbi:MAG: DUF4235 domain-containing protein [Candidatus Nanopelagicales bacterium]|jgi:hypothetical protein